MTERARPLIAIDDEYGRPVAAADIELVDPVLARASLHVEAGHVPMGTRGRLVDAVLDNPEIRSRQWIQVALPLATPRCSTGSGSAAPEPRREPRAPPA